MNDTRIGRGTWRGECECGWIGPDRTGKRMAREDYESHAKAIHGGFWVRDNWFPVRESMDWLEYWAHRVADSIGMPRPTDNFPHFLRLHWGEAEACMERGVVSVMLEQVGDSI